MVIDISLMPEKMAYTDYAEFLADHPNLPFYYYPDEQLFIVNSDFFVHNRESKYPGTAVVTTWLKFEGNVEKIEAEFIGSGFTPLGVNYIVWNVLAHPEICNLILAGMSGKITNSATIVLLDLLAKYTQLRSSQDDDSGSKLAKYAEKYGQLTQAVREHLWMFFERINVVDLHDNQLTEAGIANHIQRINDTLEGLSLDFVEQAEKPDPVYLHFEEPKTSEWPDNGYPSVIDGSHSTVAQAHRKLIREIGVFGVRKEKTAPETMSKTGGYVVEKHGLVVYLNSHIDPTNLSSEELGELGTQYTQERINAYLQSFSSNADQSGMAYWYGETLGGENGLSRVIRELGSSLESDNGALASASVRFLSQEEIVADSPHCLILMNFSLVGDKLHVIATIRSNDMVNGWPENAYGTLYVARMVAKALGVEIGSVATYSISAHFREAGMVDAKRKSLPDVPNLEAEKGALPVRCKRLPQDRLQICIGNQMVEGVVRITSVDKLGTLINRLVYEHHMLLSERQIIIMTLMLSDMIIRGLDDLSFELPDTADTTVIDAKDNRYGTTHSYEMAMAGICSKLLKASQLESYDPVTGDIVVPLNVITVSNLVEPESGDLPIAEDGLNFIMIELRENMFAKGAVFVGRGEQNMAPTNLNFSYLEEDCSVEIPYIVFNISPDFRISATATVLNCYVLEEMGGVIKWCTSVMYRLLEKIEGEWNNIPWEMGSLTLNCQGNRVLPSQIGMVKSLARTYRVPVYKGDPRGSATINVDPVNQSLLIVIRGPQGESGMQNEWSHSESYADRKLDAEGVLKEAYRVTADLILRHRFFNDPGHVAYIAKTVYLQLLKLIQD